MEKLKTYEHSYDLNCGLGSPKHSLPFVWRSLQLFGGVATFSIKSPV
jgi:hypothetical protein